MFENMPDLIIICLESGLIRLLIVPYFLSSSYGDASIVFVNDSQYNNIGKRIANRIYWYSKYYGDGWRQCNGEGDVYKYLYIYT